MNVTYHKWWSPALGRDMELKVYGHAGKPAVVFPSSGGRFYDFEDNGMVDSVAHFVRDGRVVLYAVDSLDHESWLNYDIDPGRRADRHDAYERYVLEEVAPFIQSRRQDVRRLMTTGCSMGAFHAVNFHLRYPNTFDLSIGLSGLYGPRFLLGDYMDDRIYFYFPLTYLPGLEDPAYLDPLRESRVVTCVGQGPWERCDQYDSISETAALADILEDKRIPHWADFWGHDVAHEWGWWRRQLPYFFGELDL